MIDLSQLDEKSYQALRHLTELSETFQYSQVDWQSISKDYLHLLQSELIVSELTSRWLKSFQPLIVSGLINTVSHTDLSAVFDVLESMEVDTCSDMNLGLGSWPDMIPSSYQYKVANFISSFLYGANLFVALGESREWVDIRLSAIKLGCSDQFALNDKVNAHLNACEQAIKFYESLRLQSHWWHWVFRQLVDALVAQLIEHKEGVVAAYPNLPEQTAGMIVGAVFDSDIQLAELCAQMAFNVSMQHAVLSTWATMGAKQTARLITMVKSTPSQFSGSLVKLVLSFLDCKDKPQYNLYKNTQLGLEDISTCYLHKEAVSPHAAWVDYSKDSIQSAILNYAKVVSKSHAVLMLQALATPYVQGLLDWSYQAVNKAKIVWGCIYHSLDLPNQNYKPKNFNAIYDEGLLPTIQQMAFDDFLCDLITANSDHAKVCQLCDSELDHDFFWTQVELKLKIREVMK